MCLCDETAAFLLAPVPIHTIFIYTYSGSLSFTPSLKSKQCHKLSGHMSVGARDKVLTAFKEDPDVKVLLISLKAGGVALNLTHANHIFLMGTYHLRWREEWGCCCVCGVFFRLRSYSFDVFFFSFGLILSILWLAAFSSPFLSSQIPGGTPLLKCRPSTAPIALGNTNPSLPPALSWRTRSRNGF